MITSQLDSLTKDTGALIPVMKIFSSNLIQSMIFTSLKNFDVQTAAMLCCVFGRHCTIRPQSLQSYSVIHEQRKSLDYSNLEVKYHIVSTGSDPTTPSDGSWSVISAVPSTTNTININIVDGKQSILPPNPATMWLEPSNASNFYANTLIPDDKNPMFDRLKICYADILYRWQLLVPRTKVIKYLALPGFVAHASNQPTVGHGFWFECWSCKNKCNPPTCTRCKKQLLKCTLCRLPVKGMANLCVKCGHGGHSDHLKQWFEKSDVCASGCGCYCILEGTNSY